MATFGCSHNKEITYRFCSPSTFLTTVNTSSTGLSCWAVLPANQCHHVAGMPTCTKRNHVVLHFVSSRFVDEVARNDFRPIEWAVVSLQASVCRISSYETKWFMTCTEICFTRLKHVYLNGNPASKHIWGCSGTITFCTTEPLIDELASCSWR